jgi:hypothetical protein
MGHTEILVESYYLDSTETALISGGVTVLARWRESAMSTFSGSRNLVEALADEFLARKRRGDPVTPEEYAEKHPDLANEILALFPARELIKDLGDDTIGVTGSLAGGVGKSIGTVSVSTTELTTTSCNSLKARDSMRLSRS